MKKILCWLLIAFTANTHGQNAPGILAERIYLQTDKQLYLAGELLYLKVFTTTPERKPLSFSKIAYIELLDEANSRTQVKIDLTRGIGAGWMELPLDLPTGYYRLTAYTRFMRNEGEYVFFEKNIGIVNTFLPHQLKKDQNVISPQSSQDQSTCSLHPDKTVYASREKGIIRLDELPKNIHTLSVSIAGKEAFPINENRTISQWGESVPGISADKPSDKYLPEYEGHMVTGKIVPVQATTNEISNIMIPLLSFPGKQIHLFEGQNDDMNNVAFYTTNIAGIKEIATVAYTPIGNKYRIDLQSPFVEQHTQKKLPELSVDSRYLDDLLERSVALQALYSYTKDSLAKSRPEDTRFIMQPSQVYMLDEYTRFVVMNELMIEFIRELRFRRNDQRKQELMIINRKGDYFTWSWPLVVLDGVPIMDHEIIYNYNPLLVERINIFQGEYVFGSMRFDGVVEFLTYQRNYPSLSADQSTQIVNYMGTQIPRRPYSPDYSNENKRQSRLPDYRHTLLWEPMLQVNGKVALEIPFYTSDFTGEFVVTVEGLTHDGKIISASSSFEVR